MSLHYLVKFVDVFNQFVEIDDVVISSDESDEMDSSNIDDRSNTEDHPQSTLRITLTRCNHLLCLVLFPTCNFFVISAS